MGASRPAASLLRVRLSPHAHPQPLALRAVCDSPQAGGEYHRAVPRSHAHPFVIASREAARQSRTDRATLWIATELSAPRNDEGLGEGECMGRSFRGEGKDRGIKQIIGV